MSRTGGPRFVLVSIVCAGHLALIVGFNHGFALGKTENVTKVGDAFLVVNIRQAANKQLSEITVYPTAQAAPVGNTNNAADTQTLYAPPIPETSDLRLRDYYLDSDKVDTSAKPGEDFASRLAGLLPLNTQNVVLEFWIEKDGRTVEVRCIEGECDSDVQDTLPKLTDLVFTPASKNSQAVANRKVIQIDRKLNSGL